LIPSCDLPDDPPTPHPTPTPKVDPDEYKEAMASLRGGDGASGGGQAAGGAQQPPTISGLQRRQIRDR